MKEFFYVCECGECDDISSRFCEGVVNPDDQAIINSNSIIDYIIKKLFSNEKEK